MRASQGRETVPVQGACSDGTTSLVNGSISHHVNDVKCQYQLTGRIAFLENQSFEEIFYIIQEVKYN